MNEEPEFAENDLEERIKSTRNRTEIALLLIEKNREDLLPTVLEDMFYGCQVILDIYAVKRD